MDYRNEMLTLLSIAHARNASDLHLCTGLPPTLRIHGQLTVISGSPIAAEQLEGMALSLMDEIQASRFKVIGEIDFLYELPEVCRFRINIFKQRGRISVVVRTIALEVPDIRELQLPPAIVGLADKRQGLIVVTGPTGSGKSTTVAALIGHINRTQNKHIITLEDPIEYVHTHHCSIINQREIGTDTKSFATGLRAALRQDPDVIFVGEMRDLETISAALTAAETGHLVLATLHTVDAPQTIDRIIDAFPGDQQNQIRMQLASVLIAVIAQRLIPMVQGSSRICATEILLNIPAVGNLIRSEKVHQLRNVLQTSANTGMHTMEMSIQDLIQQGLVEYYVGQSYLTEGGA
ncbi:type IV pilus twitching motility protein PilT [Paenibacillus sp. SN-8-1]|uniref:type IV pilus twitching motility protein PilT n=1 Tax=Paenibacillus sp. SN-8-1 TaxID=3435409 RepID=UPI003D9A1580